MKKTINFWAVRDIDGCWLHRSKPELYKDSQGNINTPATHPYEYMSLWELEKVLKVGEITKIKLTLIKE